MCRCRAGIGLFGPSGLEDGDADLLATICNNGDASDFYNRGATVQRRRLALSSVSELW
jgi:hypothetical protein